MNNPLASIIITNYNYGHYVISAVESAINQTYPNIEVIVVDDGSTDGSWEKLKQFYNPISETSHGEYKSLHVNETCVFYQTGNNGASAARNFAISNVSNSSRYICVLDADDQYCKNKVEILIKKLEEYDELGFAYSDYTINRPDYSIKEFKYPYSEIEIHRQCIVHSALVIKRKYLEAVRMKNGEYYDTRLHGPLSKVFIGCSEDYDLSLRLSKVCCCVHSPEFLSIVNEHGQNQSLRVTPEIFQQNMRTIIEKRN